MVMEVVSRVIFTVAVCEAPHAKQFIESEQTDRKILL